MQERLSACIGLHALFLGSPSELDIKNKLIFSIYQAQNYASEKSWQCICNLCLELWHVQVVSS